MASQWLRRLHWLHFVAQPWRSNGEIEEDRVSARPSITHLSPPLQCPLGTLSLCAACLNMQPTLQAVQPTTSRFLKPCFYLTLLTVRNANIMAPRSQKYSIYLPIHRPSRSTSRAASAATHGTRSPKSSERKSSRTSASAAAAAASHKRRSTMNSRDAAYDEEEQLRRAIEASKEDAIPEELEGLGRRPKRGRDEEEECVVVTPLMRLLKLTPL